MDKLNQEVKNLIIDFQQICRENNWNKFAVDVRATYTTFSIQNLFNKIPSSQVIIESDCVEACKTVVESYEGDGMENMNNRDQVMYDACKKALANHSL